MSSLFKHSGKIGDVIYALPLIKLLGGGVILLNRFPKFYLDAPLTAEAIVAVKPLLLAQSYVSGVDEYQHGDPVRYDLDTFRSMSPEGMNLLRRHVYAFKQTEEQIAHAMRSPWLSADP